MAARNDISITLPVSGWWWIALLLVGLSFLFAGCSFLNDDEPPVSQETMVQLIVELNLVEARATYTGEPIDSLRDSVLSAYGVNRELYAEAVEYYARRSREFTNIYDRALDSLSINRP
jgi:hypothetical protein